jgi:hypothetical protein
MLPRISLPFLAKLPECSSRAGSRRSHAALHKLDRAIPAKEAAQAKPPT